MGEAQAIDYNQLPTIEFYEREAKAKLSQHILIGLLREIFEEWEQSEQEIKLIRPVIFEKGILDTTTKRKAVLAFKAGVDKGEIVIGINSSRTGFSSFVNLGEGDKEGERRKAAIFIVFPGDFSTSIEPVKQKVVVEGALIDALQVDIELAGKKQPRFSVPPAGEKGEELIRIFNFFLFPTLKKRFTIYFWW